MLFRWQEATGKGSMKNPAEVDMTKDRFEKNRIWYSFQNGLLATQLNLQKSSVDMNFDSVNSVLSRNGPIWTAGYKTWDGAHGHVVVICGVADTGVFIHDPEPMHKGSPMWLTWSQIKSYVDGVDDTDYKCLTAA
ncbi:MAG: hypothetical protein M3033_10445 [Acidobacteriota bacterium]|nr:hypothetical protein [Acidobacteriota bacterium]